MCLHFANFNNIFDKVKRIFSKRTLREYWEKEPQARAYLETWYETIKQANWTKSSDIIQFYVTVSILKNSRVVFNIKGNSYRLVAKIDYKKSWLFIRFIGTHDEYNTTDANNI